MIKLALYLALTLTFSFSYSFTKQDYKNFSKSQKEMLEQIYMIGETKGYGLTLMAMAIAENSARMKDNNPNHICGPLQVNIHLAKASCEALETNVYYSSYLALNNLLFWEYRTIYNRETNTKKEVKRSWRKMIEMYNNGYMNTKFAKEVHVKKVVTIYKVLKEIYKG